MIPSERLFELAIHYQSSQKVPGGILDSESTLTQEITAALMAGDLQLRPDHRIPVLALLQCSVGLALASLSTALRETDVVRMHDIVLFSDQTQGSNWPDDLRFTPVPSDELLSAQGCLCCSMRSDLASALSQLFLQVLRRQAQPVRLVIIVTTATDAAPLRETLRHAPFLAQRYRLAGCVDLSGAGKTG